MPLYARPEDSDVAMMVNGYTRECKIKGPDVTE